MHPLGVPKSDALLTCRYPPAQVQRMKVLIHGRNLEITPALREYTNTKLERATSHFGDAIREADVHLSVARNPRVPQQTAEVTVFANGTVIRAQERSENLYASIDLGHPWVPGHRQVNIGLTDGITEMGRGPF